MTAPARTILDLAGAGIPRRRLERAVDEAERLRLCGLEELVDTLNRHPRRPGAKDLSRLLARHRVGSTVTRSELEERFIALCRRSGLPAPTVNVPLLGLTVDFMWSPDLVAELDGAASHLTRRAFQDDRDRDSLLVAHGYRVMRFTWWDVVRRPAVIVDRLRRSLNANSARLPTTSDHPLATSGLLTANRSGK